MYSSGFHKFNFRSLLNLIDAAPLNVFIDVFYSNSNQHSQQIFLSLK